MFLDDSPSQVTALEDQALLESPCVPMDLISDEPKVSGRAGDPGQNSLADSKRDSPSVYSTNHPPFPLTRLPLTALPEIPWPHEGGLFLRSDILSHWTACPQNSSH